MANRFSNEQLVQILRKSARRINRRLCLTDTDEEISISASGEITPDDSDLEDIVLLQAECMIINIDINNDFSSSADGDGGGYFVKDGEQTFDTKGEPASRASARSNYMSNDFNPCAELEKAILIEKLNRSDEMRDIW